MEGRRIAHAASRLGVKKLALIAVLASALFLYLLGAKFLLMPALIAAYAILLPVPSLLNSWFSRLVLGMLLVLGVMQIGESLQFLLFPLSKFPIVAVLTVVCTIILLCAMPERDNSKVKMVSGHDIAGCIVAAFFMLPFAPIFFGHQSIARIAETSGYQVVDSTIHYSAISQMTVAQHFLYKPGGYYPSGFHLSVAFIQNTFFNRPFDIGWRNNAILFFMQYMLFGFLAAYAIYFLCASLGNLLDKDMLKKWWPKVILACSVGPILALVYLLPFMVQGFLPYLYVVATIAFGLVYVIARELPGQDHMRQWSIAAYLLFVFGATSTWPLLMPPLFLIGLFLFIPRTKLGLQCIKEIVQRRTILTLVAFGLQFIPLYFQMKYAGAGGQAGINANGNLHDLHYVVLAAGLGLVFAVIVNRKAPSGLSSTIFAIFIPLFVFVGVLAGLQYFLVAEVRYYVIKTALLLEIMLLAFAAALLLHQFYQKKLLEWRYAIFIPFIPFISVLLLISHVPNPLRETRELLKTYSTQEKPAFYEHDVYAFVSLGLAGKLGHFNATELHVNSQTHKISGYMQLPFWANVLHQDATDSDLWSWRCNDAIYTNLAYGNATDEEQQAVIQDVHNCAHMVTSKGHVYYIVTDKASYNYLQGLFGSEADLVY